MLDLPLGELVAEAGRERDACFLLLRIAPREELQIALKDLLPFVRHVGFPLVQEEL